MKLMIEDPMSIICGEASMLTQQHKTILKRASTTRSISKGEYIYAEGDNDNTVYLLLAGAVKIGTIIKNKELIKMVLHRHMIFGESVITGEKARSEFAIALDAEVKIMCIDVEALKQVMAKNFDFCIFVMNEIKTKLQFAEKRMESLVVDDARTRIIDFIKYNADKTGKVMGLETLVQHNFTKQDIANYTGTSRQTVTTVFNDLKKANQIFVKRRSILIRDMASLV